MFIHCVSLTYSPHWTLQGDGTGKLLNQKYIIGLSNFKDVTDWDIASEIGYIYFKMINE